MSDEQKRILVGVVIGGVIAVGVAAFTAWNIPIADWHPAMRFMACILFLVGIIVGGAIAED